MSEREALVDEGMKLVHKYGIEPISPRSPQAVSPRRRRIPEGGESTQAETELARPASRAEAEPAKAASRAEAEIAKAETPSSCRHDRKCSVCRHRDRADIEWEFLHWYSPEKIAEDYGIAHHSSIYRHAHATGLFAQRAMNLRIALGPIIEQAMIVPATADNVIRAVIAFAHFNDRGEWVEPPRTIIHQRADQVVPIAPAPEMALVNHAHGGSENPNRELQLLEYDPTR